MVILWIQSFFPMFLLFYNNSLWYRVICVDLTTSLEQPYFFHPLFLLWVSLGNLFSSIHFNSINGQRGSILVSLFCGWSITSACHSSSSFWTYEYFVFGFVFILKKNFITQKVPFNWNGGLWCLKVIFPLASQSFLMLARNLYVLFL